MATLATLEVKIATKLTVYKLFKLCFPYTFNTQDKKPKSEADL